MSDERAVAEDATDALGSESPETRDRAVATGGADSETGSDENRTTGLVGQLAKGSGIGFVGRIGGKVLAVALEVLLTRLLGPSQYGLYALGHHVRGVSQLFAQLGLKQGAIRFGSIHFENGDDESLASTVAVTLVLSVTSGIATAAVLYAFADEIARLAFDDPAMGRVLRLFAVVIPFYVLMELTAAYCQAFKRIESEQFLKNVFRPIANLLFVGGAFALGYHLAGAIVGLIVAAALSGIAGCYLLFRVHGAPIGVRDLSTGYDTARSLLTYSIPMMFVAASYLLATRTDRLMLGMFRGVESVGIYNVAAIVTLQFSIVHSSLLAIFKPIVADVSESDEDDRIPELYNTVKKWSTYGTVSLFVVTAAFAEPILSVFGPTFTRAEPVLYVLPLMYIGGSIFGPNGALLSMVGKQNIEFVNGAILISLNVAFNYLLIPAFGALGAAIAVVSAGLITNAIQIVVIYAYFGFHPFDRAHLLLTAVATTVVCTSVAIGTALSPVQRAPACALVLFGCVVLFYRQIDPAERALFEEAMRSR